MTDGPLRGRRAGGRAWAAAAVCALALAVGAGVDAGSSSGGVRVSGAATVAAPSIHLIKHVVVIMQENRSFDSYFGTFPGADGIPTRHGRFTVCVPDPARHGCDLPYHDRALVNLGAKHNGPAAISDIDGGRMDGFVAEAQRTTGHRSTDVLGYHDSREIPNYWTYARDYVLQDHMFEPNASWSLPAHLFTVSEWSATCSSLRPSSCHNDDEKGNGGERWGGSPYTDLDPVIYRHLNGRSASVERAVRQRERRQPWLPGVPRSTVYAWTDMTYLLHQHRVSWAYYVSPGVEPDCADDAALCRMQVRQRSDTPGIWNPLPNFETVAADGQLGRIQSVTKFFGAARGGTLPAVSWIVPNQYESEHAPGLVSDGQSYVTSLINAIMRGPDWASTAIFLTWDDWGGFYDHVAPPRVDRNGTGCACPDSSSAPMRGVATSTTRRSASTPSTSSSKTTSSVAAGSTRRPTAAPIPVPACATAPRCSATCSPTSTSVSGRAGRYCYRWRRGSACGLTDRGPSGRGARGWCPTAPTSRHRR